MSIFSKFKSKKEQVLPDKSTVKEVKELSLASKPEPTLAEMRASKEKEYTASGAKKTKAEDTKESYRLIVKPLITEKGTYLASENKYLFAVSRAANKISIKKAIAALYGVTAVKVNIIKNTGKKVRYGKTRGKTKAVKKAIITIKKGESIQVYEGV